jgi:hypothetical protein
MGLRVAVVLAMTLSCVHAWGQFVISAKSGLINHVEGLVLLSGEPIVRSPGARVEMKQGSDLRAEEGRAEVLLNPGLFLRIGENSMVRMLSNDLTDTRIEFVSGAAIIGPGRRLNASENSASAVSIVYRETIVHLRKNGTYRFDGEPAQLRVYAGEAIVARGETSQVACAGEMIALGNPGPPQEFDVKAVDALGLWSKRRAMYISRAHEPTVKRRSSGVWPRAQIPIIFH